MKKIIGWMKVDKDNNPIICSCHPDKGLFIRTGKTKPKPSYMEKGWKIIKVEINK